MVVSAVAIELRPTAISTSANTAIQRTGTRFIGAGMTQLTATRDTKPTGTTNEAVYHMMMNDPYAPPMGGGVGQANAAYKQFGRGVGRPMMGGMMPMASQMQRQMHPAGALGGLAAVQKERTRRPMPAMPMR